jgi:hypothetical protein
MKTAQKPAKSVQFDNIATPGAPVWRGRVTTPLTPPAVRSQLINQSADLADAERQRYVSRRLTALDRALDDDEAAALDEWLVCEELLNGRTKSGDWGDRTSGGGGWASPIPDTMMARCARHAALKRRLPAIHLEALYALTVMSSAPYWDLADVGTKLCGPQKTAHRAKKRFIDRIKAAAFALAAEKNT